LENTGGRADKPVNRRLGRKRPLTGPRLAAAFCRIHSITRCEVKSYLNSARPDSEVKAPSVRRASNRCLFRKTRRQLPWRAALVVAVVWRDCVVNGSAYLLSRAAHRFCPPKCHCDPRATTVSMWRTRNPTSTSNGVHTCASGRCRGDAEQDANVLEQCRASLQPSRSWGIPLSYDLATPGSSSGGYPPSSTFGQ
jgi:hypothetical protein